jgi:hypothetical protein
MSLSSLPHLIEIKIRNVFFTHFYFTNEKINLESDKESHPSRVLYIGTSKMTNNYYAHMA